MIDKFSGFFFEKMVMKEKVGSKIMLNLCLEHKSGEWNRYQDQYCKHFQALQKWPIVSTNVFAWGIDDGECLFLCHFGW